MSINPKILARLGRVGLATLTGSEKQVKWATTIRSDALKLTWPDGVHATLTQVKDATWWIANKHMTITMKFKEPAPNQLASGCSPSAPGVNEQPEHQAPVAPSAEYIDAMTPLTGAPVMIPNRSEAAQKRIDEADQKKMDFDERVLDAEKWAASVSLNPKLAESAILAVLSRLYKDPIKSRLRTMAWHRLGEAQCSFAKDEDAIRRMLEVK